MRVLLAGLMAGLVLALSWWFWKSNSETTARKTSSLAPQSVEPRISNPAPAAVATSKGAPVLGREERDQRAGPTEAVSAIEAATAPSDDDLEPTEENPLVLIARNPDGSIRKRVQLSAKGEELSRTDYVGSEEQRTLNTYDDASQLRRTEFYRNGRKVREEIFR